MLQSIVRTVVHPTSAARTIQLSLSRKFGIMASSADSVAKPTDGRSQELRVALAEIKERVKTASAPGATPTLVAVSKYKPASDILACYEQGHLDFGENYVQELVDKAMVLPIGIRWHFIGTLQSNKAKTLAAIPNLYCIQTLASIKSASALNKAIPNDREMPLCVLMQVNTSEEDSKSGLPPLTPEVDVAISDLGQLADHILNECPKLQFGGLMTIGALERSLDASGIEKNADFETLKETRDLLEAYLHKRHPGAAWGHERSGRLILSMGMSSDFEAALQAGSDVIRVGSGIFGLRPKKET